MSVARGSGTATRARAATWRASTTSTRSPRSCSPSGSGPSATRRSRRSSATSSTSPTGSTCAATSRSIPRSTAARYDDDANTWTLVTDDGRQRHGAVLHHGRRQPLVGQAARHPGARRLPRPVVPHAEWPHEGVDFTGQAGRLRRHRFDGHPGAAADREAGRAPVRVPADGQLLDAGGEPAARSGRAARGGRDLRRAPPARRSSRIRACPAIRPTRSALDGRPTTSAAGATRRAGRRAASARCRASSTTCFTSPEANATAQEFAREQDPRDRARPGGRGAALPAALHRHAPHVRRHRLLRDVQPRQRRAGRRPARRRSTAITPTGDRDAPTRSTRSTRSCSRSASTR